MARIPIYPDTNPFSKMKDDTMKVSLIAVFLFGLLSTHAPQISAAGYIEEMDKVVSALKKTKTDAANRQTSENLREDTDSAFDFAMRVGQNECGPLGAYVKKAHDALKDSNNKRFLKESQGLFNKMTVICLDSIGKIEQDARKDNISKREDYASVQAAIDKMIEVYMKFKANSQAHAKALKNQMDKKASEWNRARADDEVKYKKASEELEKFIKTNMNAVEKGEDYLDELEHASRDWASASRSGKKDNIERAYRKYNEANEKMRNWKRAYADLNRSYEEVFKRHHEGWVEFVKQTRESFKLYDGDVAESNAAYYEYMKVMYGKS